LSRSIASRRRTGRAAIVAASLLAHGLGLALLGLTNPTLREAPMSEPPAVDLDLWMAPSPARSLHRPRRPLAAPSPLAPHRTRADAPPSLIPALPLAPAAQRTAPGAAPAVGGAYPAPLPGQARGDAVRQALRGSPVGCANRDAVGLTRREREACDDAFGRRSVQTAEIAAPIEPSKRAEWDAAARRKEIIRRRKEGAVPPGVDPSNNAGGTRTNGIGILGY
jgi:hypothetical protein